VIVQAGKEPVLVDVDVFALQNAYETNYTAGEGTIGLVNIGASVMNHQRPPQRTSIFWRDVAFGGNQYTEAIQRELNLPREEAERLKLGEQIGEHSLQQVMGVLNSVSEDLAAELQKTFDFFVATSSVDRLDRVVLGGGSSLVLNLNTILKDRFQVDVEVMNRSATSGTVSLTSIRSGSTGTPRPWRWRWAWPFGWSEISAMIKINLVAETPTKAARAKRAQPEFSLGARQGDILLVVVLALALLGIGTRWLLLKNERDHLREVERAKRVERDELQPYIQKVQELETKRDQLRHKINVINNLKQNQRGPVRIMDEVSRALPDLVWLTRMTMKGNSLTISGTAMDETAVANYISNLDSSPFFQERR